MTKTQSLARVTLAYVAAIAGAIAWLAWGPDTDKAWLDALFADLVATVVIFGFSRAYENSSFYDPYWSVIPPLLLLYWWQDSGDPRSWLIALVVGAWAIRLTCNWVYGWPGLHHEDWRYPLLKNKAGAWELPVDLVAIHVIPTFQVFLASVPMYVAVTHTDRAVGPLDAIAVVVGLGAVTLELVADIQMHRFVRERQPGQVMDRGLWSWSRHPNYFGEISFWFSLALFGIAASPGNAWWLFAGTAAMVAMFLGASIPMMEERSLERRPSYQDVVDRVSKLVPRPPRKVRV